MSKNYTDGFERFNIFQIIPMFLTDIIENLKDEEHSQDNKASIKFDLKIIKTLILMHHFKYKDINSDTYLGDDYDECQKYHDDYTKNNTGKVIYDKELKFEGPFNLFTAYKITKYKNAIRIEYEDNFGWFDSIYVKD